MFFFPLVDMTLAAKESPSPLNLNCQAELMAPCCVHKQVPYGEQPMQQQP
jgi:hypothetical protein